MIDVGQIARVAYERYVEALAEQGLHPPVGVAGPPGWEAQRPEIRNCWRAAVERALASVALTDVEDALAGLDRPELKAIK